VIKFSANDLILTNNVRKRFLLTVDVIR